MFPTHSMDCGPSYKPSLPAFVLWLLTQKSKDTQQLSTTLDWLDWFNTTLQRSLLGFFSNSSPTIQIQFVHWTLFPCPLTVLVSWVCAPARAERVKEKWESIWHRIFMGTEDYGRVPALFSSWISRRLPRTNGRAPQAASLHGAFFRAFPPPPRTIQNYLKRFRNGSRTI